MSKRKIKYTVLSRIWHTGENKYYEAGAEVSLDHLQADDVERLVRKGIVAPVPGVEERAEEAAPGVEIETMEVKENATDE